jgi:hypothetical protein
MATQVSGAPPIVGIQEDVHVTGRRILATIIDGLILGALFTVMTMLFGSFTSVGPANWNGSMRLFRLCSTGCWSSFTTYS